MTAATDRQKKLILEAYTLFKKISETDKKIQAHSEKYNGELLTWYNKLDEPVKFGIEKGIDKATEKYSLEEGLKRSFEALLKLCKVGGAAAGIAGIGASVVVSMFQSKENDNAKAKFYDDNSKMMGEYDDNKKRLQSIYTELFLSNPPKYDLSTNICARERCWRAQ